VDIPQDPDFPSPELHDAPNRDIDRNARNIAVLLESAAWEDFADGDRNQDSCVSGLIGH
jgi:hypothetical protein